VRSIRRRLNEIGLYGRKPAKKPFTSAQNRSAQLQFAKEHLNWTPRQWKNIVFSDETKFNFYSSDEIQWVRRPKNERFNPKYTRSSFKHGGENVKFWGCFSAYGVGSLHLTEWFLAEKVDVMKWAAQSQDLNPIKNPLIGQFGKKMEEDLNSK
jgi:hypothetical protein